MAPQTQQASPITGLKRNSLGLRLWHWANAAVVSGLLITILFLFVIVKMKTAGPEFQKVLSKEGVTFSREQERGLTRIVSHRIWDWHIGLGVALTALLVLRVAVEMVQKGAQRFGVKLRVARQIFRQRGSDLQDARHSLLVKYSYLAFYLMLVVMVVTGLVLIYADDVEFLHRLEHTVKEVHNFTMYLVIAFTVGHLVGVVYAEVTKNRGIVSDMIHGGGPAENV
ncbi:cytochrome b/b6 domain-containing protein [Hymenobacter wooponensis]|uniref:Cytochrome b/b6 domain-containing protein n=1 Tax=Hymenobacter wooponensis TaxID=1525360 RepID=A0A4Z0MTU5_9BACT|nr:cytochrome b/b6 domain-containing protein [Hymenobacter wooponensis]TGD83213.1 cytochrome b/b6 domain-containing protein [Hymenobacter wooponensis]